MTTPEADRFCHDARADDEGERADVILARHHAELSRRVVRRLGLAGRLYVDGTKSAPSTRVRAGQRVELRVPPPGSGWVDPPPPAVVLAVTARFVYVDKPAGVATHRLGPDEPPALADAVARVHPECADASTSAREGGAVHRLDLETTGVVAFARSREAWLAGRAAFAAGGGADKRYIALASHRGPGSAISGGGSTWPPAPPSVGPTWWREAEPGAVSALHPDLHAAVEMRAPLGSGDDRRIVVCDSGQPAHTTIGMLAVSGLVGTFLLRLHTGRRHQARAHLSALGWTILGDTRYGGDEAAGLMLHAASLRLGVVLSGEPRVEAPWPERMLRAAERACVLPARAPGLLTPPPA